MKFSSEPEEKKTTANELNKLGYSTRKGALFSDTTIRRLLRDTTAKGERIVNYTRIAGNGKRIEIKKRHEWTIVRCPRIVSDQIWNKVNCILDEQEIREAYSARKSAYLLSGFVKCRCLKKMYVRRTKFYQCGICRIKISIKEIDDVTFRNDLDAEMEFAEYQKPEVIQQENKVANKAFFVVRGMAYAFYRNPEGSQIPFRLFPKGEIALLADSFFNKRRAKTGLMACADTQLLSIDSIALKQVFAKYPGAVLLATNILSSIMDKDRIRDILLCHKGIDRIREFYAQFPALSLENNLQFLDKQIAAYLHMSSVTFSRLKAEISHEFILT